MELLKLSKFKLQLRALITEVRELRKQKQSEEDLGRKLTELQSELALSNELRQKLERKVSYLQNDNALLENKQKELKGTINCLLQSRENFIKVYEDSTCEMKRSIQTKDRKLAVLYEKINSHSALCNSIEKEALSLKQVVDNVHHLVSEKESIVAGLRSKMDEVSTFEKVFVERISNLETKLRNNENDIWKKDRIISELELQLEAAKINNNCQTQIEEFQKTLSAKEVVIQNLNSEKKLLHFEVGSLGIILRKIQDTVTNMNEEDKRVFSSILEGQTESATTRENESNSIKDAVQNSRGNSPNMSSARASSPCQQHNSVNEPLQENKNFDSCVSEASGFFSSSLLTNKVAVTRCLMIC
ncbi:uncharacterized protein LOC132304832 [Cornus florida]|uniref:uncharacterized protein LOC132304832 n=1 Tax=Cornus florida TaxID=4283 RepID=UPI00289A3214|nr:uncharacterized protein LOC132304832 [Cornus florida]